MSTRRVEVRYELLEVTGRDVLGEGPWWDAAEQRLWWVDIKGRRVRNATLDGAEGTALDTGQDVGFAVPDDAGGLLAGLRDGLHRHTATAGWQRVWAGGWDTSDHRINDGKTDASGRLWFGTMHDPETAPTSALYRADDDGVPQQVLDGVVTSNGLGWSPDGRIFYYTDSLARTIWAFDHDPADGTLSRRRVLATDPAGYVPDGLTVDVDGAVWAAKWDGSMLVRYRPDGTVDAELVLPVRRPTSAMFAGPDLSTLVVTSAGLDPADGELAGAVFLIPTATSGLAQVRAHLPVPHGTTTPIG